MPSPIFPCRLPIVQAPMAGVQDSTLAIAVARAGGLGSLPGAMLTSEKLVAELEAFRDAGVTTYNLNFFCHSLPAADAERERRWRKALAPYFREFRIDEKHIPDGPGRRPFCAETLAAIRPFRPAIVSFHFGLPEAAWIEEIRSWGGQVWSSATTVDEGRWLAARGADVVIAQGLEAGGHRGLFLSMDLATQRPTLDLLSALVRELEVPVIAAGGIAGPRRVQEAFRCGACAVQVGTAYLCCDEARTSALHRAQLQSKDAPATALTNLFSGRPARGIVNRLMSQLDPLQEEVPEFPLATSALAPLRAAAEAQGLTDFTPLWCGTDASGCRSVSAESQTEWLLSSLCA